MKPKTTHCQIEFCPDDEGIFEIDGPRNYLLGVNCPFCGFLITLGYSYDLEYWTTDDSAKFWKFIETGKK